jgi:hypothetical protein
MSEACVDAVIELANEHRLPLLLIGSRRQIECTDQGGGYVNGWTTETFARYVRQRDKGGYVLLCRDHGGPWQNYPEVKRNMGLVEAMESAKHSFAIDLQAGYDLIHIDPSEAPAGVLRTANVLEMLFELYDFVVETARRLGQPIVIEIGTEEQNGGLNSPDDVDAFLKQVRAFCHKRQYDMPLFIVAQTGTLVRETRNIGHFGVNLDERGRALAAQRVADLAHVTRRYGVFIKEHNGDYLTEDLLSLRPGMGVGATNIAPEFGVAETRFLLETCDAHGLGALSERFLELSFACRKWEKWLVPGSTASDRDKAVMAGHYVFGEPAFKEIYARIRAAMAGKGMALDRAVRDHLKAAIARCARPMGLVPA